VQQSLKYFENPYSWNNLSSHDSDAQEKFYWLIAGTVWESNERAALFK